MQFLGRLRLALEGKEMAKIAYIYLSKIKKTNKEETKERMVLFQSGMVYDKFDIDMEKESIRKRNDTKSYSAEVSIEPTIIAVRKVKDANREILKIIIYDDCKNMNNSHIRDIKYCDMLSIKDSVMQIVKMGTGFLKSDILDIEKKIENASRELDLVEDNQELGKEQWMKDIAKMYLNEIEILTVKEEVQDVAEDVKEKKDTGAKKKKTDKEEKDTETENKKADKEEKDTETEKAETFDMLVKDFKDFYESSEYKDKLSIQYVRKYFLEKELTQANTGRTDMTVKINGTAQKVIRFQVGKLRDYCKSK